MQATLEFLAQVWPVVVIFIDLVIRVLALIFIPRNRRPQTALAWLVLIFVAPIPGILLFWLLGTFHLPKKRREKQVEINKYIIEATDRIEGTSAPSTWPSWLEPIVKLNRKMGAMPFMGGNTTQIHTDYEESIAAMTAAMGKAKDFIHVEFYILSFDRVTLHFFDAMKAAVDRGVTVRVLVDHIATIRSVGANRTTKKLDDIGVLWHYMLPVQPLKGKYQRPDLRNHRKLLVVDGHVAYTGSQNVIDSTYNKRGNLRRGLHWKDFMVRFEGPVVSAINALFVTDWYAETDELLDARTTTAPRRSRKATAVDCQVVPSGPGFEGENNLRLFNALVYAAQERVIITSPYFVPDDSMLYAITNAAQRGLDVQLIASEIGDQFMVYHAQRSYYEALLRAGVRIWLYKSPTVLHAKHFTIDDQVSVIGSSNMDMRSFTLDLEISVMVRGKDFTTQMRAVEDAYRAECRELRLEEWLQRPVRTRVLDDVLRLTATVQ